MWFGPSREKIGRRHQVILALVRTAIIALVLLAMLRPTLIYMQTKKQAATLVVLADQSRSMSVPTTRGQQDPLGGVAWHGGRRRAGTGQAATRFSSCGPTRSTGNHEVDAQQGKIVLPEQPEGRQTAIGPHWRTC